MANLADFQKLLIIPNPQLTPAEYLSLVALVETARVNKPLTHVIMTQAQLDKFNGVSPFPKSDKIEVKQVISPRKFILSFAKGESKVKNVQWNQSEKDVSMYISMENGAFKPDGMNFKIEGADYDAILYFNVNSFADVSKVFEPYKNLVNEAKHISLGKQLGVEHQQVELIVDNRHTTLAETVYAQIKGMNKVNLNRIGGAILLETSRFKKPIKSPQIFHTFAQLLEAGGDLNEINALSDKIGGSAPTGDKPAGDKPAAPAGGNPPAPANKPAGSPAPTSTPTQPGGTTPQSAQPVNSSEAAK
jgi:hypothetical protein